MPLAALGNYASKEPFDNPSIAAPTFVLLIVGLKISSVKVASIMR